MSKQMVLVARTNKVGSDSECGLGITEDEWNKLSEEEQKQIIGEFMGNVCGLWVQAEE
ncbi:DUF7167 family protein [Proteus mirabilis]|uniref:DUF7167 family protein n=1 Tax=Proteus mirabilis TaxID=584 RepID=UPI001D014CCD|nr:hypothetical protein [Proteus mirabilis]